MTPSISPKDLALLIGVSESSLKRWVDEGRGGLAAMRTSGGHRRISVYEAVRFVRQTSQNVVRPELLGFNGGIASGVNAAVALSAGGRFGGDDGPARVENKLKHNGKSGGTAVAGTENTSTAGEALLLQALQEGDRDRSTGLIIGQFLMARSVAEVFDGPMAFAMHRLGELWQHSPDGIMIEHRATEICIGALHHLRALLPPTTPPPSNSASAPPAPTQQEAAVAIGGAGPDDPYQLPSLMASTVLLECGYRDVNLGANVPEETLLRAVKQHTPRPVLAWLSVSVAMERQALASYASRLSTVCHEIGAKLVVGGRGAGSLDLADIAHARSTHLVSSMCEFASMARAARRNS